MGDKNCKSLVERVLGDVTKSSATKQIVIGTTSGWLTGFLTVRCGKVIAVAVGSGIIILQIANEQGYINVNWDKVNRGIDKVADRVDEKLTGEGPNWSDKVERFVDRKLDKAENILKNKQNKAKRWWHGADSAKSKELHIFLLSFLAGVTLGFATA